MKPGDTVPVTLNGYHVVDAVLVEIDGDQAILEIPGTRVVMGIHSSLGDLPEDPNAKEKMIIGLQEPEIDETRQAYIDAGIELDDEDDSIVAPAEGGSLKDIILDEDV